MVFSHKIFLLIFVPLAGIPMLADAQIIKRKSKSDFKAPVIYTLKSSSDTAVNAPINSTIDKDSNHLQKDSAQEAVIKVLSAIQKDVHSIKKHQRSGDSRNRAKKYSNADTSAMSANADTTAMIENYDHQEGKRIMHGPIPRKGPTKPIL